MNLHNIVRGAISSVNPDILGTVRRNAGTYSTSAAGKQTPNYLPDVSNVIMQIQPLSSRDLKTLDALNITDIDLAVYVNGEVSGVDREQGKGGDLLLFNGNWWLVTAVLEAWAGPVRAGWTKAGVTKQRDPVA